MPNWTLKLDEAGSPVLQEGKPVYVDADLDEPVETAFDVNQLHGKILSLGRESKTHREKYKNTATELGQLKELFGEVDDVAEWKTKAEEALKTVQNLKDQDFVKADRVEKLKREMSESFSEKEKRLQKALSDRESELNSVIELKASQIRQLMVSNRFATCDLFSGPDRKTNMPVDAAEALFGRHFRVEDGDGERVRLVAYDDDGQPISSRERPGEDADFNEAIRIIFDRYPHKDSVLRSSGGGSGAAGGTNNVRGRQSEFQQLQAQLEKATSPIESIAIKRKMHALVMKERASRV